MYSNLIQRKINHLEKKKTNATIDRNTYFIMAYMIGFSLVASLIISIENGFTYNQEVYGILNVMGTMMLIGLVSFIGWVADRNTIYTMVKILAPITTLFTISLGL